MNTGPSDEFATDLDPAEQALLGELLRDPVLWQEPDPMDADAIVAAIQAESGSNVTSLADRRSVVADAEIAPRSDSRPFGRTLLAAAAGAAIALIGFAAIQNIISNDTDGADDIDVVAQPESIELALEGTDLDPDASAQVLVTPGLLGTRIDLDVVGLDPAPPGTYYEAWLRQSPEVGVSAGTFHLRGGDGEVELWAGVSPVDYPLLTVTLQSEAQTESSGQVVLRGLVPTD